MLPVFPFHAPDQGVNMNMISGPKNACTLLQSYFKKHGCRVDNNDVYQDKYNIDFTLSRVAGVHSPVALGVRVTAVPDPFERQSLMIKAAQQSVVSQCIYIEIASPNLDTGVIIVSRPVTNEIIFL